MQEGQKTMSKKRTPINSRTGIKISEETRRAYEGRDKSHDDDPEYGRLSPDQWATAMRRDEFFRPVKKLFSFRIDAEVLDYFQRKGEGYQALINAALREKMEAERQQQRTSH
jgi:uncharacterized protein (DUF4415 family)